MTAQYFKLNPKDIAQDINQSPKIKKVAIQGTEYLVYPHVYPSDKFRTTNFLLKSLQSSFKDATVCDMGCGIGIIGLYALQNGAKKVIQADINPSAVKNARANIVLHNFKSAQINVFESNTFENIPKQTFDLIIFNIPFHSEPHEIHDPLEYAFHDPLFQSTETFLLQAKAFSHPKTRIIIAFSNKGDTQLLEKTFSKTGYSWSLWKVTNSDQEYDNRLYMLELT